MSTILLVEDRAALRSAISRALEQYGYTVELANNGAECLERYRIVRPDLVLLDMFMPVMNGFDALLHLRQEYPDAQVIAMSGGPRALRAAKYLGARLTLKKPFEYYELVAAVKAMLAV